MWWVCPAGLQALAFSHLEVWDFLCFLWLMGETWPSREPQVSLAAVLHVLWRLPSLLVGCPVERVMLAWVSPAGQALGAVRLLDGVAEHTPAPQHNVPLSDLSFPISQSSPLVLPTLLACPPFPPSTSSPVANTSLSSPTAPGGIMLAPCGLGGVWLWGSRIPTKDAVAGTAGLGPGTASFVFCY